MTAPPSPVVTGRATWRIHAGGVNYGSSGGIDGQVTRLEMAGATFYVRENVRRDQFAGGSGVGMALKRGESRGVGVLELCAPEGCWDAVAAAVGAADAMKRPVVRNRRFTVAWAEALFRPWPRSIDRR
jgi:hypothetical protein